MGWNSRVVSLLHNLTPPKTIRDINPGVGEPTTTLSVLIHPQATEWVTIYSINAHIVTSAGTFTLTILDEADTTKIHETVGMADNAAIKADVAALDFPITCSVGEDLTVKVVGSTSITAGALYVTYRLGRP